MKIIIKLLLIIFTFFLNSPPALAVSAAPSSLCEIEGRVINFKNNPANYQTVFLKIDRIQAIDENGVFLCDDKYIENIEERGALFFRGDSSKRTLTKGQKIKANIKFGGDEKLGGNFMSNVNPQDSPNSDIDNINNNNLEPSKKANKNFWVQFKCFFVKLFGKSCLNL